MRRFAKPLFCVLLVATANGIAAREVNIAPQSRVTSVPYVGASLAYLTDGKIAVAGDGTLMLTAPLPVRTARPLPLQYEFRFQRPEEITRVRLLQHDDRARPAHAYRIELDVSGHGRYERTVAESDGRGGVWDEHRVSPPVVAFGLRFRIVEPSDSGSNRGAPAVEEIEIYARDPVLAPPRLLPPAPLLEEDRVREASIDAYLARAVAPESGGFRRGLFGSMWSWWTAGEPYSERAAAGKVALLRRLKVNRYWLYPGVYVARDAEQPFVTLPSNPDYRYFIDRQLAQSSARGMRIVPFASSVVPGNRENVLKPFVEQMHESGVKVIANEWPLPYGLRGWDFPRVVLPGVYPSLLASAFVRDASTKLYREYMQAGVDGIALGGDEFFLYGDAGVDEDASPVCRDASGRTKDLCKPTSRQLFRDRFGFDFDPTRRSFSPALAKWTVFKYEQLARIFAGYATMMKEEDRDAIVTSLFRAGEENRPAFGIAFDVMGSLGGVDEMSSNPYWSHNSHLGHWYFANETKRLMGASRSRTAVLTLQATPNFDRNGYRDPLMVYGPAFSALMHGARGINFYKQDYLFANGANDAGPWVEKFFKLTALLDSRGLAQYDVPKAVALLYSRASEDWWQLGHAENAVESMAGTLYQNAVMEALLRSGVPFDLYYLDQPASLDELAKYPVAILPYPYSISQAATAKLRKALASGTRMISIERSGEVDEFGAPYASPALLALSGIDRLRLDIGQSNYVDVAGKVVSAIRDRLGDKVPLTIDANGKDVECAVLQKSESHWLFCLNWESRLTEVNIGVRVSQGAYEATVTTLDHVAPARIDGRKSLTAADLGNFRMSLPPGDATIVSIAPVNASRAER